MTEKTANQGGKTRRLSREIFGIFAISLIFSIILYLFLSLFGAAAVQAFLALWGITPDETDLYRINGSVFGISLALTAGFFILLFLILLGERLAYIRTIIQGIEALSEGKLEHRLPIEGNNELTRLAEAVNYLAAEEEAIKAEEKRLSEDREELIRTLSHDIRTPLTALIGYTELFRAKESPSKEELSDYLLLVHRKANEIREISDILLDGSKRSLEYFDSARLLMTMLAEEFEEALQKEFSLKVDLSGCTDFPASLDVQELRRIFDNLITNVQKYADPQSPVCLSIQKSAKGIVIRETNAIAERQSGQSGYRMGLNSIRRIAQSYGGDVRIENDGKQFAITVTLSDV